MELSARKALFSRGAQVNINAAFGFVSNHFESGNKHGCVTCIVCLTFEANALTQTQLAQYVRAMNASLKCFTRANQTRWMPMSFVWLVVAFVWSVFASRQRSLQIRCAGLDKPCLGKDGAQGRALVRLSEFRGETGQWAEQAEAHDSREGTIETSARSSNAGRMLFAMSWQDSELR